MWCGRRPTPPPCMPASARYFSPPPFELVATQMSRCSTTRRRRPIIPTHTPKAERADYYDVGVRAEAVRRGSGRAGQLLQGLPQPDRRRPVRRADHPDAVQLSDRAGNMAASSRSITERAISPPMSTPPMNGPTGENIVSSEFQFDPGDLAYIADHFIPLDHQQIGTVSAGASYKLGGHAVLRRSALWHRAAPRWGDAERRSRAGLYQVNLGVSHRLRCRRLQRA